MTRVSLSRIAQARSGDKGEGSNAGVLARSDAAYAFLKEHLTEELVRAHVSALNRGGVRRYAADNMRVLNFLLEDSLGGGGSASLKTDAQGKTHGLAVLRMKMEIPQEHLRRAIATDQGNQRGASKLALQSCRTATRQSAARSLRFGRGSG